LNQPAAKQAQAPDQPDSSSGKKKRRATGWIECQLGILLGLGGLAASRLGHLWIAFDVFAHFTLHVAVVALAFAVGLVMPRAKLLTAFVLLVAGILGIGLWPHVASQAVSRLAGPTAGQIELKVASFNTNYDEDNSDAVRAEIVRLNPDVMTLIEFGPSKRPILAELKDRFPYQADCFAIDFCNLAVLSKFPVVESDAKALWEGAPYIRVKLGPEAGGLTVFGVHTIRFPHSRAQFRQARVLGQMIEKTPGHKLVMGDFNATPFSRIVEVIESRGGLERLTRLPSWPSIAGLPQIAIDHIFVSRGLAATQSQQIGEAAGSDHFPVVMKIAVPLRP
jgi:endonuclease/exonuclease/phosphatase (EEP) superfamily protein YafD